MSNSSNSSYVYNISEFSSDACEISGITACNTPLVFIRVLSICCLIVCSSASLFLLYYAYSSYKHALHLPRNLRFLRLSSYSLFCAHCLSGVSVQIFRISVPASVIGDNLALSCLVALWVSTLLVSSMYIVEFYKSSMQQQIKQHDALKEVEREENDAQVRRQAKKKEKEKEKEKNNQRVEMTVEGGNFNEEVKKIETCVQGEDKKKKEVDKHNSYFVNESPAVVAVNSDHIRRSGNHYFFLIYEFLFTRLCFLASLSSFTFTCVRCLTFLSSVGYCLCLIIPALLTPDSHSSPATPRLWLLRLFLFSGSVLFFFFVTLVLVSVVTVLDSMRFVTEQEAERERGRGRGRETQKRRQNQVVARSLLSAQKRFKILFLFCVPCYLLSPVCFTLMFIVHYPVVLSSIAYIFDLNYAVGAMGSLIVAIILPSRQTKQSTVHVLSQKILITR